MSRNFRALVLLAVLAGLSATACAAPNAQADHGHDANVVARVGERTITLDELDAKARADNMQAFQQLYDARRASLDTMVSDLLLEQEAASRGISKDALVEEEITKKTKAVSEEDIAAFFNENQARMGGQTLEAMTERIRGFLTQQSDFNARTEYITSLRNKAGVKITLDPPRVDIAVGDHEPAKGSASAPVTIIEYSEFQCPYCSRVGPTIKQVMDTYGDKVRLVFRDFPLPFHDNAHAASQAAQCAHAQGKFWEYHDKLFANQTALAAENLKQYAADLGLDAGAFDECLDSGRYSATVDENHAGGTALGVQGTPAFFVNGRFLSGAQPFEAFKTLIDEELELKASR